MSATKPDQCWFRFELAPHEKREFAQLLLESDGSEASRVALHARYMTYCGAEGVMLTCIGSGPDLAECLPLLRLPREK